ncbi:unnamed protein product [Dicrocoelium dendriticum]|nr:unnamed protein product [Dicrocoelium dendriticum]
MEELAMFHRDLPVLTPRNRGDPRLRLRAVRLGLKLFRKPGDPSSCGGYIVLSTGKMGKILHSSLKRCLLLLNTISSPSSNVAERAACTTPRWRQWFTPMMSLWVSDDRLPTSTYRQTLI